MPGANLISTPLKRPSDLTNKKRYQRNEDGTRTKDHINYEGTSTFPEGPLNLSANTAHIEQEKKADSKIPLRGNESKYETFSAKTGQDYHNHITENPPPNGWIENKATRIAIKTDNVVF